VTTSALAELRHRLAQIHDLGKAGALLAWDQQTQMPPAGGAVRVEQLATVSGLAHRLFVDERIGALLEELRPLEESLDRDSVDASLIRVSRRDWE
jgi:carboxypeptidase Taq